ncbi:ABC transporter permease [Vallitalea okinawensis]|uniref:ABC transporter permease n=1 Tax=Vallitalea okinawensis TaxID=2078660 RepID=UPI000CFA843C|nr:ABC transporter permease [Vallitalea okinawensis]
MSTVKIPQIPQEKFKRVQVDAGLKEKIEQPSLTFWQDVRRRLIHNKPALVAFFFVAFLIAMAVFGPMMTPYSFKEQIEPLKQHTKLPPRVPGLEKLGIFDGTIEKELGEKALARLSEESYEITWEGEVYDRKYDQNVYRYQIVYSPYIDKGVEDEYYWFGTDELGRDIWTRVWRGTRVSLAIGLIAACIDLLVGVTYGAIAGYFGGRVDNLMMRFTEILNGIPYLVIVIMFILIFENAGIVPIALALAITGWIGMARIVRAHFLKYKQMEFVLAAKTLGTSSGNIIFKHILPNIIGQVVVMVTFTIPAAIFTEAFLAFIGLGIAPPETSLGILINDGYKFLMTNAYMMFVPASILCILMLALNIFANGLRDAVDPRMREG